MTILSIETIAYDWDTCENTGSIYILGTEIPNFPSLSSKMKLV